MNSSRGPARGPARVTGPFEPITTTPRFEALIVHREPGFLVVDKPAGVLSQPGPERGVDLVTLAKRALGIDRIGVLHRLDRNVSGLVMLADDPEVARVLSAGFAAGAIERSYVAVTRGQPTRDDFSIDRRLAKDERTNTVVVRDEEGDDDAKDARTEVHVRARFSAPLGRLALLEVRPITGRSHQLRVHLASEGLPIVGDPKYGVAARGVRRPLLHAERLRFRHPRTGAPSELVAAAPFALEGLRALRR